MVKPSAGKSDPDGPDPDDLVAIFGANLKTARMKAREVKSLKPLKVGRNALRPICVRGRA